MPQALSPALRRLLSITAPPQHMRSGGLVRGPGTGTSDSIPARLSDGEFVLPADTVKKVGVNKLRDLVDATHRPSGKPKRPGHFVDGGIPSEDEKRKLSSFGDAAAAANNPAVQIVTKAAPAIGSEAANQIPTDGYAKAPLPDGSQSNPLNTELGRNVSNTMMALPGVVGAIPTIAKTGGAISSGLNATQRLMNVGVAVAPGGAPGAATAAPAPAFAAPSLPTPSTSGADMATPTQDDVRRLADIGAPTPPPPAALNNTVTRIGNSYTGGPNISGDVKIDNAKNPGVGVSNVSGSFWSPAMQRAHETEMQTLGLQQRINDAQDGIMSGPGMAMLGTSPGSLFSRTPEQQQRDAQVQARSIDRGTAALGRQAQTDLETQRLANIKIAGNLAEQQARGQVDLARTGLQEQGATARNTLDNQTRTLADIGRIGLDRDKFALEKTAADFQNRTAQRLENAQTALESAQTPEDQRSARQRLMALMGKSSEDIWKAVALQGGVDAQGNKTESILGAVNERTGEMRRMEPHGQGGTPMPADASKRQAGAIYVTPNGQRVRWDGKGAVPV